MNKDLCKFCGWGSQIKPSCRFSYQAMTCDLNLENARKYFLRNKRLPIDLLIVHSERYQGPEGKGDSYERLTVKED